MLHYKTLEENLERRSLNAHYLGHLEEDFQRELPDFSKVRNIDIEGHPSRIGANVVMALNRAG
jgi:hypothetical protein